MARLPALVDAVAALDSRGRGTVDHVARVAREAGYIRTTSRGRGAAEMSAVDAAALLLGLNGAELPKDAPGAIERFGKLKPVSRGITQGVLPRTLRPVWNAKSFREAVELLIEAPPEDESQDPPGTRATAWEPAMPLVPPWVEAPQRLTLAVTFQLPDAAAMITAAWPEDEGSGYAIVNYGDPAAPLNRRPAGARSAQFSLGLEAFRAVHQLLQRSAADAVADRG